MLTCFGEDVVFLLPAFKLLHRLVSVAHQRARAGGGGGRYYRAGVPEQQEAGEEQGRTVQYLGYSTLYLLSSQ